MKKSKPKEKKQETAKTREQQEISDSDKELMSLLGPGRAIDLRIQRTFEEKPESFVALFVEKPEEYSLVNAHLVDFFCKKNVPGIYVSLNKPLDSLILFLKKQGIEYKNVFFVDAVTKMTSGNLLKGANFCYIDSPKSLIDLSVAIESFIQKIPAEKRFILIDSLSTLLVYNRASAVEKFVHSVSGKMRAWKVQGVFAIVKNVQEEFAKTVAQFCDETIEI